MTREELLEECFGRSDFGTPTRVVELTVGRNVLAMVELYIRRLHVRYDGDFAVEGRGVDASTTLAVGTLEHLCVHPDHRGRGYAGAMVRRALNELRENRPLRFAVVKPTEDLGLPFWGRFGFAEVERPDGFLVAKLQDEPWPRARIRLIGSWPES